MSSNRGATVTRARNRARSRPAPESVDTRRCPGTGAASRMPIVGQSASSPCSASSGARLARTGRVLVAGIEVLGHVRPSRDLGAARPTTPGSGRSATPTRSAHADAGFLVSRPRSPSTGRPVRPPAVRSPRSSAMVGGSRSRDPRLLAVGAGAINLRIRSPQLSTSSPRRPDADDRSWGPRLLANGGAGGLPDLHPVPVTADSPAARDLASAPGLDGSPGPSTAFCSGSGPTTPLTGGASWSSPWSARADLAGHGLFRVDEAPGLRPDRRIETSVAGSARPTWPSSPGSIGPSETARTDPLTGARNRLRLTEDLRAARARMNRLGHAHGLIAFDLDHFKQVNDHPRPSRRRRRPARRHRRRSPNDPGRR